MKNDYIKEYINNSKDICDALVIQELLNYIELKEKVKKATEYIKNHKKTITKQMAKDTKLEVGTFMWNVDELLAILGDKE